MKLRTKLLLLLFALVVAIDLLLVFSSLRGCAPRVNGGARKLADGWAGAATLPLPA